MNDLHHQVWEGWTPMDFIESMVDTLDMIMEGNSLYKPFKTKKDLFEFIQNEQPYYKKPIPEVNKFFAERYHL